MKVNTLSKQNGTSLSLRFRQWLMAGGDVDAYIEKKPLAIWLIENNWGDIMDEAVECGVNPNQRDADGNSWIHQAIHFSTPFSTTSNVFRKMDKNWWKPNKLGLTPLHLPIYDQKLSETIINRWWTEQRSWKILQTPFDPLNSGLPQERRWKSWESNLKI